MSGLTPGLSRLLYLKGLGGESGYDDKNPRWAPVVGSSPAQQPASLRVWYRLNILFFPLSSLRLVPHPAGLPAVEGAVLSTSPPHYLRNKACPFLGPVAVLFFVSSKSNHES